MGLQEFSRNLGGFQVVSEAFRKITKGFHGCFRVSESFHVVISAILGLSEIFRGVSGVQC